MATPALAVSISTAPHNIPPPMRARAFVGRNVYAAEAGHVEDDATVATGLGRIAVTSAADGERQMIGGCEAAEWPGCPLG